MHTDRWSYDYICSVCATLLDGQRLAVLLKRSTMTSGPEHMFTPIARSSKRRKPKQRADSNAITPSRERAPPNAYHFKDWNEFLRSAVRYHRAFYPHDHLFIDRINTLRKFMAEDVIRHLGGFVKPSPRYRKTHGWQEWSNGTTGALKDHDHTVDVSITVGQWVIRYKQGRCNERQLWEGLDSLVNRDLISRAEQHELFWSTIAPAKKSQIKQQCIIFDPRDEFSTKEKQIDTEQPGTDQAKQRFAEVLELLKLTDVVIVKKRYSTMAFAYFATITLLAIGLSITVEKQGMRSNAVPLCGIVWSVPFPFALMVTARSFFALRQAQLRQTEYASRMSI